MIILIALKWCQTSKQRFLKTKNVFQSNEMPIKVKIDIDAANSFLIKKEIKVR